MLLPPHRSPLLTALFSLSFLFTHPTIAEPLVAPCPNYSFPTVACMNKYGSVLPEDYDRTTIPVVGFTDTYASTQVPSDPSFAYVSNASFPIYDAARAPSVPGPSPAVDFMFQIPLIGHEAPVYDPTTNRLLFSKLLGNETSQYTIDLSATPPTLSTLTSHPPTIVPAPSTPASSTGAAAPPTPEPTSQASTPSTPRPTPPRPF